MKMDEKHNLLKGGEFLITDELPENIYTPGDISEETKMIRDMSEDFISTEIIPILDRIDHQESGLMPSLLNKAGELGLLGTSIPEEYGGFGRDFNTNTHVAESLGAGFSFPVSLMAHTGIGTLPILYFGTEKQKKDYLPKLATGELKAAYCLTEPESGSDALAAKTRADLSEDGQNYVLNGQKMWITNGGFADIFIVFAQINGEKFSAFIVEKSFGGVVVGEEENKMGIKGSSTCQIFFENTKVPSSNLLGEVGKGHLIAFNILNIGRFKLCAATLGGAKGATTVSIKYANERKQFGQAISSFGAIKHKIAEQAIQVYACESALYRTSDYINKKRLLLKKEGATYEDALMGSAKDYAVECAILKIYGSEVLDFVVDEGVQIHGGYGFSEEYPLARAYRDSRINRIFEGTNEINRLLIMDMLLKKAMKGELNILSAAKKVQDELMSIPDFSNNIDDGFTQEIKQLANYKKGVLMIAGAAAQTLMMKLSKEQEILMNLSDMVIQTFIAESMLLRVMKTCNEKGEANKVVKDMLHVFFFNASNKINSSGKEAINGFAEGDMLRMLSLGLKRFTKPSTFNAIAARRRIAEQLIKQNEYSF